MPGREGFAYALLRVVPDAARGERVNVGVVLFCRRAGFLEAVGHVPDGILRALAPELDLAALASRLQHMQAIAAGAAGAGPIATLEQSERFHWLTAPSSTIVQPSAVHTGLSDDPAATLASLFATLVKPTD